MPQRATSRVTALMALTPQALLIVSRDRTVLDVNERFCTLTGIPREEAVGLRPPYPWWPPDAWGAFQVMLDRITSGDDREFRGEIRHTDGRRVAVEEDWVHVMGADGTPTEHIIRIREMSAPQLVDDYLRHDIRVPRNLVDSMSDGVMVYDATGRVAMANTAASRILGVPVEELVGGRLHERGWRAFSADGSPFPFDAIPAVVTLSTGDPQRDVVMGVQRAPEPVRWLRVSSSPLGSLAGVPLAAISTFVDISELKRREGESAALHRIAELVATGAASRAVFGEIAGGLAGSVGADIAAVTRFEGHHGHVEGFFMAGDPPVTDPPPAPIDLLDANTAVARVWSTKEPVLLSDVGPDTGRVLNMGELPIARMARGVPIRVDGEVWGAVSVAALHADYAEDAPERMLRFAGLAAIAVASMTERAQLVHEAGSDALTGLSNRRVFDRRLLRELLDRHPVCLITLDIDHFKKINDLYGHAAGDRALATVAAALHGGARAGDTVARLGGDEFAWILPDTGLEVAQERAEHLVRRVRSVECGFALPLSASAGVVQALPGETDAQVLHRADEALYHAKSAGGDTVQTGPTPRADAPDATPPPDRGWRRG
ncbi:MAG: diguanylate cyclase [Thermoleophilia bacterium]